MNHSYHPNKKYTLHTAKVYRQHSEINDNTLKALVKRRRSFSYQFEGVHFNGAVNGPLPIRERG